MRPGLVILMFALLYSFCTSAQDTEWKLAKSKNGVQVYTRQKEGMKIKEFKAITVVSTKIEKLEALIDNVEDYTDWQANIQSAEIDEHLSSTERYDYLRTDVPWPVSDRDMVIHSTKTKTKGGGLIYKLMSEPKQREEEEGYVRIITGFGKWQFVPLEGSKIKVIQQFYADPAGNVPAWIINMFIVDGPHKTFVNLRELVWE